MSTTENYNGDCSTFGKYEPSFGMMQQIRRVGIDRWTAAGWQGGTSEHWDILDRAFGDEAMRETHSSPEPQASPRARATAWRTVTRLREPENPALARIWHDKPGFMALVLADLATAKAQRKAQEVPF